MAELAQEDEKDLDIEDTSEPFIEEYEHTFDSIGVLSISGSYLGQQTHLNTIKQLQLTNDPQNIDKHKENFVEQSTIHIHELNKFRAKKYKKLNKSLVSKKSKNHSKSNTAIANFWDREYAAFCIAKNVSYAAIKNYAYTMKQVQHKNTDEPQMDNEQEEDHKINKKDARCDVLIQCGGCYAVAPSKTSSFCDGFVLHNDDEYDLNEVHSFTLPKLERARSNSSAVYHDELGIICYGGRSNKKDLLNVVEVLNINENEFEWNTNMIPASNIKRSRHPSIGFYDDILFVCGGRHAVALNSAECINLKRDANDNAQKWNKVSSMKFSRSFASNILQWKEHNALLVMGGYGSFLAEFYAEKYDLNADKWCSFPKSNFHHKYNPCIRLMDELLFVFCDKRTKSNLGVIEILDTRTNKWMKCKTAMDDLLQFDSKQELRRLICI